MRIAQDARDTSLSGLSDQCELSDPSLSGERSVVANVDADVGVPAPVSEGACVPETPVSP